MVPGTRESNYQSLQGVAMETSATFNAVFTELILESFMIIPQVERGVWNRIDQERDGMVLQMTEESRIENPREYSADAVEDLRQLLAAGSNVQKDPRRENFYLLDDNNGTYYIHVSPITGNVMLLAKWSRLPQVCYAGADSLVA